MSKIGKKSRNWAYLSVKIQSRYMSDPTLSDNDFKNKRIKSCRLGIISQQMDIL